ncbi:MAG: alcohol dehydrogenase catalytic domain-containing protein [Pirellulaceae bacterium]|nr:alcohol dehydrogenase catalytic domain-containing protein [Pirellulaceae bacterium]
MIGIAAVPDSSVPQLVELPHPVEPSLREVVCRTLQLGVCGTDREILASLNPEVPGGEDYLVLGHECLAEVETVGADVQELSAGDLVVPLVRCPLVKSNIRADLLSPGQFVERGILRSHGFSTSHWTNHPEYLLRIEPEMASFAVLAEPTSISEKGINESLALQEARLGKDVWRDQPPRVLVTGLGPIGFTAVVASRGRGWPVTHFGRDPEDSFRARLTVSLGASYVNQLEEAADLHDVVEEPFDLVLECTGSEEVMFAASHVMAPRGIMVWLGSSRRPQPRKQNAALLMRQSLVRNNIFIGCVNSAPRDFRDAMVHLAQMHQTAPEALAQLITDRVTLDDARWHYQNRRPQGIKTVVVYDE